MFVKRAASSPATPFRLLKVLSALDSFHDPACFSAVSNSNRQGDASGVTASGTLIRRAGGGPDERNVSARMPRSSSEPSDFSVSHSIVDSARPNWPTCEATCTSVMAIRVRSSGISSPAASRARSNRLAASCMLSFRAAVTAAWPRASGLSG